MTGCEVLKEGNPGKEGYDQEKELKKLMKEFEESVEEEEIIIPLISIGQGEEVYPEDEEEDPYGEIFRPKPTTLEDSVKKVLAENKKITLKELQARFPPIMREKVKKIAIKLRPGIAKN